MRIAIDARAFGWAGVGRYTRCLLQALLRVAPQHDYIVLVGKADKEALLALMPAARLTVQIVDAAYYTWREQLIFWRQLQRVRADLWHFTHFNVPLLFRQPYVVTVHDVTRFVFPGQTRQSLLRQVAFERVFRRAVEAARGVVCVSRATQRDLQALPITLPRRIWVVPEAADESFQRVVGGEERARARLLLGWPGPFVLYVGVWMSHKNLPRLLAAYVNLLERYPYVRLVLTGRPRPGYVGVDRAARALGLEGDQVLYLGFVPPALLPALYAEATALLLPSLYEGFGLTALEAAAVGTPVVASNVSSLPEVLGEAAEYVNPEYVPGMAAGMVRIVSDSARRDRLAMLGRRRASQYSWEEAARRMAAVYEVLV
ncbi:MAG: glycosyltransferase family 4 protein [Candidatus Andersenbacteria bacterium]|nr:glycosyltransferase family 4 protein [Candidatus Andersenbacteria bacterium]